MGVTAYPAPGFAPGMLIPYAGSTAPNGWLIADGSPVSRTVYSALFAVIGTTHGAGDGTTTFNIPNLKGKVIAGLDAGQTEFAALGTAGGSKTSTAPHTHGLQNHTHTLGTHTHLLNNHSHTVTINSTGAINTGNDSPDHAHSLENHDHTISHWHTGNVANTGWNGLQSHGHYNHGGYGSEAPNEGANIPAAAFAVNIDGTAQAGPNGTNRSSWFTNPQGWSGASARHQHDHTHGHTGSSGGSNVASAGPVGGSDGPNNNTSTDSSVTAASGNLQPYLTLNYLIKT